MARKDEQVQRLEDQLAFYRKVEAERRKPPPDLSVSGCGSSDCQVAAPSGMAPVGRCCCDERKLRYALQWWQRRGVFLEETIAEMRIQAEADRLRWMFGGPEVTK